MLFKASRTSSVPELLCPLLRDTESAWERRNDEGKQEEGWENREEEEEDGGLEKRLCDDVEEEQEEDEDEGLAVFVSICGDRISGCWLLRSRLWFCCWDERRCCGNIRGWLSGVWDIRDSKLKSLSNSAELPVRVSRFRRPSVLSVEGEGGVMVRSKMSSRGFWEDRPEGIVG